MGNSWKPPATPVLYEVVHHRTRTLALTVSAARVDEFKRFIDSVNPTTNNPVAGDRILSLAMRVIRKDQARQTARRRKNRRARGS